MVEMFLEFQSQVCKENTLIQEKKKPDKDDCWSKGQKAGSGSTDVQ